MTQRSPQPLLFLTGGTGFIGSRLRHRLGEESSWHCRMLCRTRDRDDLGAPHVEVVSGDLRQPGSYRDALRGCDLVVHMAAVTGRARRDDFFSVNAEGTRALIDACGAAGVRRFVFISSIAATYQHTRAYHYADSKRVAEASVRASGLEYAIIRPTIVLGRESPIWLKLRGMASLPVMPVPGDGRARVQPIYVNDLVEVLLAVLASETLPNRVIEIGGCDVVMFEQLLRKIRRRLVGHDSRVVHVPLVPLVHTLASVDSWFAPFLPVTAGQLAAFGADSVAADDPFVREAGREMMTLDRMLDALIGHD